MLKPTMLELASPNRVDAAQAEDPVLQKNTDVLKQPDFSLPLPKNVMDEFFSEHGLDEDFEVTQGTFLSEIVLAMR